MHVLSWPLPWFRLLLDWQGKPARRMLQCGTSCSCEETVSWARCPFISAKSANSSGGLNWSRKNSCFFWSNSQHHMCSMPRQNSKCCARWPSSRSNAFIAMSHPLKA
eukprot:8533605-Lingulodinium_polyedra.AAC.1